MLENFQFIPDENDKAFNDSPDAGHPLCKCSRCNAQIKEEECPMRVWESDDHGEVPEDSKEWRYCTKCMEAMGIRSAPLSELDDEYFELD